MKQWHDHIASLALITLASSAAWGVYQFQLLFTPWWVALLSAASFEMVYIALATIRTTDRRRAQAVTRAAVAVSVLYNVASSLFHLRPDILTFAPLWLHLALAGSHGVPLAIVAYNVAILKLHEVTPAEHAENERITLEQLQITAGRITTTVRQLSAVTGIPVSTLYRRLEQPAELMDGSSAVERGGTTFQDGQ